MSRKYRPQTFAEILGQGPIVSTLKNALRLNKVAPAYLFCGTRGTGKTTLARIFAKALNCAELQSDQESCGKCASCLDIAAGSSLDILEIDGASHRGLEDMREIKEQCVYATSQGRFKIYIIDEVHMLTKEAFNALLKLLEEPPQKVKFLFATTEPHKILPTILSRCQRFDLRRIQNELIIEKLQKIAANQTIAPAADLLEQIAILSDGSLRDAESLFDQLACSNQNPLTLSHLEQLLGSAPQTLFFELTDAIISHSLKEAFVIADKLFQSGREFSSFFEQLLDHFSSLMRVKIGQGLKTAPMQQLELFKKRAEQFSEKQCLQLLDLLFTWQKSINRHPIRKVHIEMLLLQLIQLPHQVSVEEIVSKLIELEEKLVIAPALEPLAETKSPPAIQPEQKVLSPPIKTQAAQKSQSHYDNLIHFTAVELDATVETK